MTFRHLKIFVTVYQTENITKAAEELNMTQPAVTRAVQELEEHYSIRLFERIHRRLYVTEAGRQLYPQAIHIVSAVEQMEKNMSDWDETGVMRIGAGTTLGSVLLPRVIPEFQRKHPLLTIRSIVTDTTRLQAMLLRNEIDFALIEGTPDDSSLKRTLIGRDQMVLILPRSHPLCSRENILIRDLAGQPIIVSEEGSASRSFMEHLFSIHGMKLTPVMESGSMPVIFRAVQAGIGLSLVPRKLMSLYGGSDDIEERKLSYEILTRENYLVWHEKKYMSKAARELTELIRSCGEEMLRP